MAAGESVGTLLEAGGGGALATDIFAPVWPWSNDMLIGRPLRGGEYGGGGRGDPLGTNQPLAITITNPPRSVELTLGFLICLSRLHLLHPIRRGADHGRSNPFLGIIRLDCA